MSNVRPLIIALLLCLPLPATAQDGRAVLESASRALGADGVIVGSALVREIERNLGDREAMIRAVETRARELNLAAKV